MIKRYEDCHSGLQELADGAELCNRLQRYFVANTRLGIPALIHEECLFGYWTRDGVAFPQAIGLEGQFTIAGAHAVPITRTRYTPVISIGPGD